ncbi:hypothetical protein BS78_K129300 [Paspalum vaginatum]|uniref:Uncharacterized protein n=1 Tax=Paspalum vaginatum TaxID=158149 RepID=A0A9W7XB94_9POAL|nr:hypothetical protein BS78_K129300 [Paspalum vaginatum]
MDLKFSRASSSSGRQRPAVATSPPQVVAGRGLRMLSLGRLLDLVGAAAGSSCFPLLAVWLCSSWPSLSVLNTVVLDFSPRPTQPRLFPLSLVYDLMIPSVVPICVMG